MGAVTVLRRGLALGLVAVAGIGLGGCASDGAPAAPGPARATFTAGGVRVTIALGAGARPNLVAQFRPTKDGFHLYSADLPPGGVDGLGQRTSLEPVGALRAAGPLRIAEAVHQLRIKPLHVTLPVYPDGPVTARRTVHRDDTGAARVSVSFAACSDSVCYPPVRNRVVELG